MSFADMVAADAALFVDPAGCPGVESVTYKPHGGTPATINVNVLSRLAPDVAAEVGRVRTWHITIFVRNSSDAAIGVASVNTGGDSVSIPTLYGSAAVDLSVIEIINQSPAGWLLLLR